MENEEPTEEENEEAPETSLRDDLEAAIEEHEEDDGEETSNEETETPSGEEKPESGEAIGGAEGEATPEGINAPLGFSPEEREAWSNVPPVVQAKIHAREKEIEEAVANTGEYRRTHTAMTNLAQSYAPILAAEGADTPMQAVEGLFRTVAELRVGSPQQTAQKMADLIGHYNIDIGMLDSALSGSPMPNPEQDAMARMIDERMAPVNQFLQQQSTTVANQQQVSQQAVNTELQEFSKDAEFLGDVRHDMADLIDMASKRGEQMSFKDAYAKACAINPSISKVMADRELVAGGQKANGKLNASSSLRNGPGASTPAGSDGSLRGDIMAAWEDAEN